MLGGSKRTPAQWTRYLDDETTPVTLDEYAAGCLARILGCMIESTQAARHTEGMVGALDDAVRQVAPRIGVDYAASGEVRRALDRHRRQQDEQRECLAIQEAGRLRSGEASP